MRSVWSIDVHFCDTDDKVFLWHQYFVYFSVSFVLYFVCFLFVSFVWFYFYCVFCLAFFPWDSWTAGQLSRPTQESMHVMLQLVKVVAWLNIFQPAFILELTSTTWKVSVFGIILVLIFPYSNWIRRHTECLSIFSPNVGKYWSG